MFFSSPVNTIDSHIGLLQNLNCQVFLKPEFLSNIGEEIIKRNNMRVIQLPNTEYWLRDLDSVPVYPYLKTFSEARSEPFVAFHSSGTTGIPKIIVHRHGTDAAVDAYQLIPALGGECEPWAGFRFRGKRVFSMQPWFHACGIPFLLNAAIYYDFVGVIMPSVSKFDVSIVSAVHRLGNVQASFLNPALLIEISKSPQHLSALESLDVVSFTGAPLPQQVGDRISKYTVLMPLFGSTECSSLPVLPAQVAEDWPYYKYSDFLGGEFRHFAGDCYEFVIVRNERLAPFQGVFSTIPEMTGNDFHTKDLYQKHPERVGWWRHCGRTDDVLIFTDGRKLNPIRMEAIIEAHPVVKSALICGHGRAKASLLVQLEENLLCKSPADKRLSIQTIWPSVEKAMTVAPLSGLLTPDMVLFTTSTKPMAYAGAKLTVQRTRSIGMYTDELAQLYDVVITSSPNTLIVVLLSKIWSFIRLDFS